MPFHRRMLMSAGAAGRLVEFKLWGGAGGTGSNGSYRGGAGGAATGTYLIPAGTTLKILAGQRGAGLASTATVVAHPGGGKTVHTVASAYPANGAGYSGVFVGSVSQANALLVAGGGGGGGYAGDGGAGGGIAGERGHLTYNERNTYGHGGTQAAGGAGGSGAGYSLPVSGGAGSGLQGGNGLGPQSDGFSGAGGGGGWYGGGAGAAENSRAGGGGGGGSGYRNTAPPAGIAHVASALYAGSSTSPGNEEEPTRGRAGESFMGAAGGRVLLRVDGGPWLCFGPTGAEQSYTIPAPSAAGAGDVWDAAWANWSFTIVGDAKTASNNNNHATFHNARSRRGYATGKVYLEFVLTATDSGGPNFGLLPALASNTDALYGAGFAWAGGNAFNASGSSFGAFGAHGAATRCMLAVDVAARTVRVGQSGVWLNGGQSVTTLAAGHTWHFALCHYNATMAATVYTDPSELLYHATTSSGFNAQGAGYAAWLA